ncbi:hypothetical protein [Actinomadura sp. WMMB 499]|uniref:hypothetical protein n=1 Tax=Actinomadura sp. WMMB 499 TaxID=1219491 RepID=UPI001247473F|nr:hypothetical protein [Actinomadura sp. WMMB 499]QFG22079.1 hypothetical protein F7P10_14045 [Actinomadura sp. WMMB 499]
MKIRFAVPVAALALAFSVSACGGDSEDGAGDGASSTAPPTAASSAPGTTAPTDGGSGGGSITGNGGGGGSMNGNGGAGGGGEGNPQMQMLTKVVECMRAKGYEMPEPEPGNPAIAPKNTEGKDPNKVNADSQECVQQAQGG